jgi:hypothetical protein
LFAELLEDRTLPSFLAPVSYPVGLNPQAVAVGDFTGSGIPDIVVANFSSGNVSVLLGKGDGTFLPAQNYVVDGYPKAVAVGDFNGDGKLDIVTANTPPTSPPGGTVSVLLGNGDGTFQPALNYVLPAQSTGSQTPSSVAVGDFNKDGKLDLAVTAGTYIPGTPGQWVPTYGYHTYYYIPPTPSQRNGYANVLIGNGAGGFAADNSYALSGALPTSVAVGDFTGNGKLDLAVTDGPGLGVLLGNGDGTFGAETQFATGSPPQSVAVGDFNGDNKLDLVTANPGDDTVSVLSGNGDGTFGAAANYSSGGAVPVSVAVADINGDAKLDIVTAGGSIVPGPGYGSAFLGNGNGTFQASQNFAAGNEPVALAVGDFNRDGWPDVAIVNPAPDYSLPLGAGTVAVLLNAGDWSALSQATSFAVSGFPSAVTAGTPGTFTITAKNASGTTAANYTGTVHFTSTDPQAVLPADYTFTTDDAGVHTFNVILKTAGTQSIAATDTTTASLTGADGGIKVIPAAANTLGVTAFPAPITAGVVGSFTVSARDPYGNIATGYRGTVQFTSSDSQASLPPNYTFTVADSGTHTFSATLKTTGTQWITATDTTTASVTGTQAGITVDPGAVSTMAVAGFPSPITAGLAGNFSVTLKDAYGNIASYYTGTVHFSSSDARASLPANDTFTPADAGVHTFSATLKTAGTQSITATDTTTGSLTATDGGITVSAAKASKFILTAPTSIKAGALFSLTLTVEDAYGNVVTNYIGTVRLTSTDSSATLPSSYTFTTTDHGVHTFTGLVLRRKGYQKITITDMHDSLLTATVIVDVL